MANKTATTAATTAATTPVVRTAEQLKADAHKGPWVICKNGNLMDVVSSRQKSINVMIKLSGVAKADIKERKDGSIMLAGVGHYRSRMHVIS